MSNSKQPKRRRYRRPPRRRVQTIHVVDGHVTNAPPGAQIPFMGEMITCVLCGKEERSNSKVESNWRAFTLDPAVLVPPMPGDKKIYYACLDEFPPDGATTDEFAWAYKRFFLASIEHYKANRKEH